MPEHPFLALARERPARWERDRKRRLLLWKSAAAIAVLLAFAGAVLASAIR